MGTISSLPPEKPDLDTYLQIYQAASAQRNADREHELKLRDVALREQESVYKARELDLREQEQRHARWFNPLFLGVIAASLTLFGNMLISREQQNAALAQEHLKAQTNLILEAIKTGTPESAATNLDFFIKLGFIDDPGGKIKTYIDKRQNIPVLPAALQQALEQNNIPRIVQQILTAAGASERQIKVLIVNDPTVSANARLGPPPEVEINATFLEQMNHGLRINWGSVFVLAHEIGHLLLGHQPSPSLETLKAHELEADRFSGRIMCQLGATLSDVGAAATQLPG